MRSCRLASAAGVWVCAEWPLCECTCAADSWEADLARWGCSGSEDSDAASSESLELSGTKPSGDADTVGRLTGVVSLGLGEAATDEAVEATEEEGRVGGVMDEGDALTAAMSVSSEMELMDWKREGRKGASSLSAGSAAEETDEVEELLLLLLLLLQLILLLQLCDETNAVFCAAGVVGLGPDE
jgi:hypothetical protein